MKSKSGKKISFKGQATANAEERAKRTSGYGYLNLPKGLGVFSPEPGKSVTLDFFPYEVTAKNHPDKHEGTGRAAKGAYWYKRPFKIHRNIGSEKDSVVCLGSINKPCPICEYKVKRAKEGADVEELKSLKTGDRELYIVNPLDSAKHDAGKMYVFDISYYLFQEFLESEMKEDVPDDFFDPEEGVSLKVRFKATTMGAGKPFADADKITVVDRKKQYKEAFYSEAPDLDSLLHILPYDELERKFFELDKEETEEEEEAPRAKKSTKKVVVEDEDDEEEVAPVRKKKPVVVEEEEEEEDDDEEEDEVEEPDLTWDDLFALNEKKLIKYCSANKLKVDPDDFEDDETGLREAIAFELGIHVPVKFQKNLKSKKPTPKPIAKKDRCPACKGTGKDGKGKMCKVCMGTGVKQADPDEEEDEDEEEEAPVAKKGNKASAKKATASDECPHDHTFGKDVDKYDECDACDLWDECMAAKKKK